MDAPLLELKRKLRLIWPHLDERTRRLTAANEAMSLGYGGVSRVHRACGLSRKAILKGIREIDAGGTPLECPVPGNRGANEAQRSLRPHERIVRHWRYFQWRRAQEKQRKTQRLRTLSVRRLFHA